MSIEYRTARTDEIDEILTLHFRYQANTIDEEDKKDGFISTAFDHEHLMELIEAENGIFIALKDKKIVAYAMAASWEFWARWPMFAQMMQQLPQLEYQGQRLTTDNSYHYGPVCVDKSVRGSGVFETVFNYSLAQMAMRYPILVTFINKVNPRSYSAHTGKVGLDVIQEFEFNNHQYYELARMTK